MTPKTILDKIIADFCSKILPEFHKIMNNLRAIYDELSPHAFFAMNLMDMGRGQMSEVARPSEHDVCFMTEYTENLNMKNTEESLFTAYASGCMMGLVHVNEIPSEDLSMALSLVENFAEKEFKSN